MTVAITGSSSPSGNAKRMILSALPPATKGITIQSRAPASTKLVSSGSTFGCECARIVAASRTISSSESCADSRSISFTATSSFTCGESGSTTRARQTVAETPRPHSSRSS